MVPLQRLTGLKKPLAAVHESGDAQMLWGERRGHGTFGAVQRLPMERPRCRNAFV
jgi:hypothetical protein